MDTLIKLLLITLIPRWVVNIYGIFCGLFLVLMILFLWRAGYMGQISEIISPIFSGIVNLSKSILTLIIFAVTGNCSNPNGCF